MGPQMPASDTREPAPALPLVDKLLFSAAARGLPFLLVLCPMLPRYLLLLLPKGLFAPVDSPRICTGKQQTPDFIKKTAARVGAVVTKGAYSSCGGTY